MKPSRIGIRLIALRQIKYWSQEQLSRKSGVSRSIISKIETGHTKTLTTESWMALARALDVSPEVLAIKGDRR